jgi:molybdenum cofactor cytidylyltransferase
VPENNSPYVVGALVLAAGSAQRFGGDKRKARLSNGKQVLRQTLENVQSAIPEALLVLSSADDEISAGADWMIAEHAADGMGHSIADAMPHISGWDGCLVCLGDMPFISPDSYAAIAVAVTPDSIVVPYFGEERGHPVGFGKHFFDELAGLSGDKGARHVLRANSGQVKRIYLDDPGIVQDIDTPGDIPVYKKE